MKRFELVLGQPTGEGAQALVPEAVPFQFARRLGTVVDRVPVPVVLQNRLLSSSMSIAGLLSVPGQVRVGVLEQRLQHRRVCLGDLRRGLLVHALYLSEPGFPWPAALTHLSRSAGSFMS